MTAGHEPLALAGRALALLQFDDIKPGSRLRCFDSAGVVEVVRKALPQADLTSTAVLSLIGAHDPFGRHGALLEAWLQECCADLDARTIEASYELAPNDASIAWGWLESRIGVKDA